VNAVRIHPRDSSVSWDSDYMCSLVRYIRWFRALDAHPDILERYSHLEIDYETLDDELFELIQGLITSDFIDGHIKIYDSSSSADYFCWLLPTQNHMVVWNNVKGC